MSRALAFRFGGRRERGNTALRLADRNVGALILAVAGPVRRRRALPDEIRRIGLLTGGAIGDTVLLSAVARDLAAAYPQAEVVFFTDPRTKPLVGLIEGVTAEPFAIASPYGGLATLRNRRLDVLLDFAPWPRIAAVLCALAGARFTAGFRTPGQHRHYAYDAFVEHSSTIHELDNQRRLARVLGVESRSLPSFAAPGIVSSADLPAEPYVVFHLWPTGVRSELKEWAAERWRALACELSARGHAIVLTGSAADRDRTAQFLLRDQAGVAGFVDATGKYDLAQVLDLVSGSRCVVSVNTGVMHMAAATGVPTIALNGPTAERRWGPVGKRAVSVNSTYEGCGFLDLGWEYRRRRSDCMDGISVERVLAAVLELIGDR